MAATGPIRDLMNMESLVQLALALPIGCGVGWLFGALVDRQFHQHWMVLVGVAVGAVGGIIQIVRTTTRIMKQGE